MTTADTPSDLNLGDAVAAELAWTPSVNAANTGVALVDGVATLPGEVVTYPDRSLAEMAAFRIRGVTAIADEIAIRASWDAPTDTHTGTGTGTVEEKGAAWVSSRGAASAIPWGYSRREWSTSGMDGPVHDLVGSISVEALPEMAGRLGQGPPRAALDSDMMTTGRESPVTVTQRTAILPESATGPPSRAPAAARPNATGCVVSVSDAPRRRPDRVHPSSDGAPRNPDAERAAAGPFQGTIADGYPHPGVGAVVHRRHRDRRAPDGAPERRPEPGPLPGAGPVAGHPRVTVSAHSAEQRPGGVEVVFGLVCEVQGSDRPARVGQLVVLFR